MTTAEAAALLRLSEKTIIRRVESGEIGGYRFGERSFRIPASEVRSYIAKSAVGCGDGSGPAPGSMPGQTEKHG